MTEIMKQEHNGIGGLYFITTMLICSFILFVVVRLSWDSQVVAMTDNIAYIISINVAVNSYVDKVETYSDEYGINESIRYNVHSYLPLNDFNGMLEKAGLISNGGNGQCKSCEISWNSSTNSAVVQFGTFQTVLGSYVRPHQQESVIENN